ncbi:12070_t:CDS:2, partial [Acaulospora morrowiae]
KPIKYGSTIALFHVPTRKYLSTKGVKYPNHEQYMVVCTGQEIDYKHDLWTVYDKSNYSGDSLYISAGFIFKHKETGGFLHSHVTQFGKTPKSNYQQVTLLGGDDSHWIIRHYSSKVDYNYLDHLMDGDIISLFHKVTNIPLYSHDVLLDDRTQEVSCYGDGFEDNNM